VAESDGFVVLAVSKQRLELDEAVFGLVAHPTGIGEEVFDRLASASSDMFERGQRWARASRFDQKDRGRGDVTLANLGQAQP
jgi:hypothetical protein